MTDFEIRLAEARSKLIGWVPSPWCYEIPCEEQRKPPEPLGPTDRAWKDARLPDYARRE